MKKVLFLLMLVSNIMLAPAQDIIYLNIEDRPNDTTLCLGNNQQVHVNAQDCDDFVWIVGGQMIENITPLIIYPSQGNISITYGSGPSCGDFFHSFHIRYKNAPVPNSFTKTVWGKPGENTRLRAMEGDSVGNYNFQWQGGPNNYYYDVVETGTYPVVISSPCGTTTRTFIRYDMAELSVANTDPVSGQIYLQWDTEESILQNASTIKFFCDDTTNMVGIADISNGVWVDTTTQSTGVRNYWCRTVANSGEESPLWGPIQTIFATSVPTTDPQKAIALWNKPLGYEPFSWFRLNQIIINGKDSPEIIAIDSVASTETMIEFDISLVSGNNKINIEAVYSEGKTTRRIAPSSNPLGAEEVVSIVENIENDEPFDVYPNPAKGQFTVEGTGILHITNVLGQEITAKEIDGKETMELLQGMYFVKLGGATRKIVVE